MIDIVHAAGPFCHRALLTLAEKHVPYKEEYIDFDNKPKWYAAEEFVYSFLVILLAMWVHSSLLC